MDPTELIKHAPELLKGGAAVAGALKFTDVIKAMLGPATAEIAERFRDDVRLYRFGRQLACLKKAEQMAKDAGFTPKAVPIKLLFPLLEGASLEENEDLHTMWAALLANAASATKGEMVRPGFIAILKQMAPDEVVLLKGIVELTDGHRSFLRSFKAASKQDLDRAIAQDIITRTSELRVLIMRTEEDRTAAESRFQTCLALLDNAGLISVGSEHGVSTVMASDLGGKFVEACSPPNPKT
jgi:hypothetical protein